ncbi:MAG: Gfo/Idh/MocA family oxidoreductase [Chloroflexota bacterium]|nr:Gfo/Idh/MocA family oxidoreductase [Chloroflexota bacterium]MDE2909101.1 Gfo/Idh/MocA family oxidoreductase [Chloroflexota bacterium]
MSDKIRWGLIGLGLISRKFAKGLAFVPDAEVYAVASRSQAKADAFGAEFGAANSYGSYEDLANDPNVDVAYIGTPNNYHLEHALLCLKAGKHVLCEKPFAVNAKEAQVMIDCAREKNLFLMDAFWTRYFPAMVKLRELLADKVIGDVMLVTADFGGRGPVVPEKRHFNPDLAGGAMLDVGSYCLQFASMIYGKQPQDIVSQVAIGETGVDELSVVVCRYSDYEMATLTSAVRLGTPHEARVMGTEGYIAIPDFWHPSELTVVRRGDAPETLRFPYEGEGFQFEAIEVGDCIRAGATESAVYPLDETLAIMRTLDRIRDSWGLRYPFED